MPAPPPDGLPDSLAHLTRLNLGCGRERLDDHLNVDVVESVAPDLVWDLDHHPYPLPGGHYKRIFARDVIEHLEDVVAFMEEVHRLLRPGGTVEILTPHFSSANAFTDPTHRHRLSYFSLDYFLDGHQWNFYSDARFEMTERLLVFQPSRLNRWVARYANRHPQRYEQRFAWMFPAWFLHFRLTAVKPAP